MKKIFGFIIVFSTFIMPINGTGSLSDNLTVPHTFSSGETISSNNMNQNFKKLFDEINKLKKYIFSNNTIVAEFLSFSDSYALGTNELNYIIRIGFDGKLFSLPFEQQIYFASNDCSGDSYASSSYIFPKEIFQGSYFENNIQEYSTYYSDESLSNIIYKSSKGFHPTSACNDQS